MGTKSQEMLTVAAQDAAQELKSRGWKQKEYLSAGVIALNRLGAVEQLECKAKAYSKEYVDKKTEAAAQELLNTLKETIAKRPKGHRIIINSEDESKLLATFRDAVSPEVTKAQKKRSNNKTKINA